MMPDIDRAYIRQLRSTAAALIAEAAEADRRGVPTLVPTFTTAAEAAARCANTLEEAAT